MPWAVSYCVGVVESRGLTTHVRIRFNIFFLDHFFSLTHVIGESILKSGPKGGPMGGS